MFSYGGLSQQAKLALILYCSEGIDVHVNPDYKDAHKIEAMLKNFQGSVEGCKELRECLEKAAALRGAK